MREAIGGSWLFGIVITFVVLFAGFLAYSVSYTRAFNVKNQIINYIEHAEGYTTYNGSSNPDDIYNADLSNDTSVQGKALYLIKNTGYNYEVTRNINCSSGKNMPGGYCLSKICAGGDIRYKVTTYIALEIPVVSIVVRIPITGETRTIYRDNNAFECTE